MEDDKIAWTFHTEYLIGDEILSHRPLRQLSFASQVRESFMNEVNTVHRNERNQGGRAESRRFRESWQDA